MGLYLSLDLIGPAVQGTVNILRSALEYGYVTVTLFFHANAKSRFLQHASEAYRHNILCCRDHVASIAADDLYRKRLEHSFY